MNNELVYLHFYLADKTDDAHIDDIIAGWTKIFNKNTPPLSHVEKQRLDRMFSSTLRGESTGVRYALAEDILKHPDNWITLVKGFSKTQIVMMGRREVKILNRAYAKIGVVLSFILPFGWLGRLINKSFKQWYCSQAVYYSLNGERIRISPMRLYNWALKNGWKVTETPVFD